MSLSMSTTIVGDKDAVGAPLLVMADKEGKGRALVASQPLRGGQIVLRDSPILLYPAYPLISSSSSPQSQLQSYCSHCFRALQGSSSSSTTMVPCSFSSSCSSIFCTASCRSASFSSSHTPWVCQSIIRLRDCSSPLFHNHQDGQVQARFLVAAYNLAFVSPSEFQTLLALQGDHISSDEAAPLLHSLMSTLCPLPDSSTFSLQLTAALLAKDKLNAFGLMEPFSQDKDRSVRAYGIYPRASFFNHDCLPNACRFDYVDATTDHRNTDIIVRLIHDVPQGREICLSYFPVNLKFKDRQRRLKEDYSFTCDCDRCKVEVNWSDDEEEQDNDELKDENEYEDDEAMDEDVDESMEETEDGNVIEGDNDFPHAYFFLNYMCNRDNCWGTLAPLPPSDHGIPSTVMECNVCCSLKSHEEMHADKLHL